MTKDPICGMTVEKGLSLKRKLQETLIEHRQYIEKHGEDIPDIRNWEWRNSQ